MLRAIIIVGTGGFIGSAARYLISLLIRCDAARFPWNTLIVNLAGCFLIGILGGLLSRVSAPSGSWSLLLITGFCGSFTTFSTFAKESLAMLQCHNFVGFSVYVFVSVIAGIALTAFGYRLLK